MCGEHVTEIFRRGFVVGSSPRVWGARRLPVQAFRRLRLIPTCVGSTHPHRAEVKTKAAHPHVCGEHFCEIYFVVSPAGSSPRMRGTLIESRFRNISLGLIPTYAGNTQPRFGFHFRCGAHPHVCGEHESCADGRPQIPGSSPRMRGTRSGSITCKSHPGLIPTYAGNTP